MKLYADTSALVARFHPADEFARAVTAWCQARAPEFCWNPLLRLELRHNLRRLSGPYAGLRHSVFAVNVLSPIALGIVQAVHVREQGQLSREFQ